MPEYEKFFKDTNGGRIKTYHFGTRDYFTTEELYQAFKARLMDELKVKSPELLEYAELVDPEGEK